MDDLVNDALDREEEENRMSKEDVEDSEFGQPRILVVGCGGAGNNTVNRLYNIGVEGAETIAINTDKQHLEQVEADTKMLVGKKLTEGLGAGGDPEVGKRAAEMGQKTIKKVLNGADMVFITAGMGGGTGTGVSPVVARLAKEEGAVVVGMVSMPFEMENARMQDAEDGIEDLRNEADSIIVLDNDRLLDYVPNLPVGKAFSVMDQIIAETVKGISETITQPSLINLDYADMTTIMGEGGVAVMLVGETKEKNKTEQVVKDALSHPLLDVDYKGANGGLIHITGGKDLTLKEANDIAKKITNRVQQDSDIIWGARIKDDYDGKVRVMAIMTGVQSAQVLGNTTSSNTHHSSQAEIGTQSKVSGRPDGGQEAQEEGIDVLR